MRILYVVRRLWSAFSRSRRPFGGRDALIAVLLFAGFFSAVHAAPKPNILFILSDDHALEAIGAYDSWLKNYVKTPAIDRLAAEGMRFNNLCVNNSICSPSRASILTGQYSHKNGVLNLGSAINVAITAFSRTCCTRMTAVNLAAFLWQLWPYYVLRLLIYNVLPCCTLSCS